MMQKRYKLFLVLFVIFSSCRDQSTTKKIKHYKYVETYANILNYTATPKTKFDRSGLLFSDQGAWFAYSFANLKTNDIGFSGPFLMTQQNGIWSSQSLAHLHIENEEFIVQQTNGYASHLEQVFTSKHLKITQQMVFLSGHTALIQSSIENISNKDISVKYQWKNMPTLADSLVFSTSKNQIKIISSKSKAIGYLRFSETIKSCHDNQYTTHLTSLTIPKGGKKNIRISQTFIFPEYDWEKEKIRIDTTSFDELLQFRKAEKEEQFMRLIENRKSQFQEDIYAAVLAKSQVTLQNNWRIPAGEIKYEGLFPSYHYKWFHGFWSWDSWKHAVGLSYYHPNLAKKQMKLMFEFQNEDGFIADCVFRDTLIEAHNYRDTKPPLSAWAVVKIYEKDNDLEFVEYMYPKLLKYHNWWYNKRDHDKDGICEYGSTDGSLVAAKWESGMDNAIRFDAVKILKNSEGAYSMNQESVDLNAYLYAEKIFIESLASALQKTEDAHRFKKEAHLLKINIQKQFYDEKEGWFYDTSLDGKTFVKGEGSEGWTPLWANVASKKQAEHVKNKMMNPQKFFTKVPFQTMSATHKKFNPLKGYWRGPTWLDQAYFGVKGLRNYGFNDAADKATIQIIKGAKGVLEKGTSIRENYHPITGEGLNAKNFSWSAAHLIMLLQND